MKAIFGKKYEKKWKRHHHTFESLITAIATIQLLLSKNDILQLCLP